MVQSEVPPNRPRAKRPLKGAALELHHAKPVLDDRGITMVWRNDQTPEKAQPFNLIEFNSVVFTCRRFGIPLVDKN